MKIPPGIKSHFSYSNTQLFLYGKYLKEKTLILNPPINKLKKSIKLFSKMVSNSMKNSTYQKSHTNKKFKSSLLWLNPMKNSLQILSFLFNKLLKLFYNFITLLEQMNLLKTFNIKTLIIQHTIIPYQKTPIEKIKKKIHSKKINKIKRSN
jgi:hypothetical protein